MKRIEMTVTDAVQFSQMSRKLSFFRSMNVSMLERIAEGLLLLEFSRGEKVCVQGERGDSFFVVQQGRLSVTKKKGRFWPARLIAGLGPGDFFGEMSLLGQEPRNATVTCEEPSRLFILHAYHFQQVIEQNEEFCSLMKEMAARRQLELNHFG